MQDVSNAGARTRQETAHKLGGELLAAKQQLELALATARSSVTAQEQVVASMLERLTATPAEPDLATAKNAEASGRRAAKKLAATGT